MSKTIALVGNPNSGKTTLFNALTGANQHVGNWPGVTVEKKEGQLRFRNQDYTIVDLPGTYSLGALSEDEIIARDYIIKGHPDVVINVVDATNVERNLYLTTQLLEMGVKVVIALNMVDEAESRQIKFDLDKLSKRLQAPIIPTVASKRQGIDKLLEAAVALMQAPQNGKVNLSYGAVIDQQLKTLTEYLDRGNFEYPSWWLALKIIEGDQYAEELVLGDSKLVGQPEIADFLEKLTTEHSDSEFEIVNRRYEFVKDVTANTVFRPAKTAETLTDRIDKVVTHKYWGLPIFALIMLGVFLLTFTIGEDLLGEFAAEAIEGFGEVVASWLGLVGAPSWLMSFVANGIFGGLGEVVEFIPLIVVLYLLMGFLEDSGYMARAAYVMDNMMRAIGLQGKTFISMIVGFGCNVPGVMSTRTLDSKRDRMIAILINPFMSCGAKIPIYLVFIGAFFPKYGGLVLFLVYFLGIAIALLTAKLFSKTLFRGEVSHFIMELPPYRWPTLRNVLRNMWDNVAGFLTRAGTTILAVVSLLWILAVLPSGVEAYGPDSILGRIGMFIAPLFKPAGFGTWQASVGLFSGIAAKEAVVATLGMVYAGVDGGAELINAIRGAFTPLTAAAFMVMTLLYTPCAATLTTIKNETQSYKWAIFSALYTFAIGWLAAVLVYQVGSVLGFA